MSAASGFAQAFCPQDGQVNRVFDARFLAAVASSALPVRDCQ